MMCVYRSRTDTADDCSVELMEATEAMEVVWRYRRGAIAERYMKPFDRQEQVQV